MLRNKLAGGIMMVAGTSIGSAMLAMPTQAAKVGLTMSLVLLCIIGYIMGIAAYLMAKIYKETNSDSTVSKMAGKFLGKPWQILAGGATLMLLYALMVAYIDALSGSFHGLLGYSYNSMILSLGSLLFVSLAISDKIFDLYNRIAFATKIFFMVLMVALLYPHVTKENLVFANNFSTGYNLLTLLPVFVTSFGFHGGIPFIFKFFEGDSAAYNKAIFGGVVATLVIYFLWLILSFGVLPQKSIVSSNTLDFIGALNDSVQSDSLNKSISIFTILVIFTSLFGVAVSLFDFVQEILQDKLKIRNRFFISGLVFFIPVIVSIFGKELFMKALGIAGVALTIIAIFIPCMICIKKNLGKPILIWTSIALGIATVAGELMTLLQ